MANIRVYRLSADNVPQKNIQIYKVQVLARVPDLPTIRVHKVSVIARITPYAILRSGKWREIETLVRRGGFWR